MEKGEFTREDVSKLLDSAGYEKLPEVPRSEHITAMVTGGPATGKTGIFDELQMQKPELVENSVRINPDDYKAILANPAEHGRAFADMAHRESSLLSKEILARLDEKLQAGSAPHVVMDVVSPNEARMKIAGQSEHLIVYSGTLPPEQALDRSYGRFLETGRQTPTEVVLDGARKASASMPDVMDHSGLEMLVYSTDVPKGEPPKLVAEWDANTKALNVYDPDSFVDFVERRNLNPAATGPDDLYPSGRGPGNIADSLAEYTDKGATINLLDAEGKVAISYTPDGVETKLPLESSRGSNFYQEVGEAHQKNITDVSKPRAPEAAEIVSDSKTTVPDTPEGKLATSILEDSDTRGFWADPSGENLHFFSEEHKAIVSVTPEGTTLQQFDDLDAAQKAFGSKMQDVGQALGDIPDLKSGGLKGLSEAFKSMGSGALKIVGEFGERAAEVAGRATKLLGVLGGAYVSYEATNLALKGHEMAEFGMIPPESLPAYDTMLGAFITQAVADPTLIGGELAIQKVFDEWADAYGITDPLVKAELQPGLLINDLKDAIEGLHNQFKEMSDDLIATGAPVVKEIMDQIGEDKFSQLSHEEKVQFVVEKLADKMNDPEDLARSLGKSAPEFSRFLNDGIKDLLPDSIIPLPSPSDGSWFDNLIPDFNLPSIPEFRLPTLPDFNFNIIPDFSIPSVPEMLRFGDNIDSSPLQDVNPETMHASNSTPDGVTDRTTEVASIIPTGSSLTVQSSDGQASLVQGIVPDNQVQLMQNEEDSVSLDQARAQQLEQQRAAELAAQQQQQAMEQQQAQRINLS